MMTSFGKHLRLFPRCWCNVKKAEWLCMYKLRIKNELEEKDDPRWVHVDQ